jgi:nicotinate-nucleotide adenylyltransferase
MKKKIGIYSGSFNPIHIGHLALANYLCEYEVFDEIWFVVSPVNPWKVDEELLPDDLRYHLVQLSIEGYTRFKASDFEFHLPKPSYTINTLDTLQITYSDYQFALIIGADNLVRFFEWKDWQRILDNFEVYVFPRPNFPIDKSLKIAQNVHILNTPLLDISSTFIRNAIKEKKDLRYFMHPMAWQYLNNYLTNTNHN